MLVLTRKVSESFMIGEDIEVTVLKLMGDKVRFGIKAPKSVPVHRREVWEAIKQENIEAARVKLPGLEAATEALGNRRKTEIGSADPEDE